MPATNIATFAIARQSAKGVIATAPQYRFNVTDADLSPTVETANREETGLGRFAGATYITVMRAEGGATVLARPSTLPLFLYGVAGAQTSAIVGSTWAASTAYTAGALVNPTNTTTNPYVFEVTTAGTSGTTEPVWPTALGATVTNGTVTFTNRGATRYSHAATPADDQPWFTVWREVMGGPHRITERFEDCKITEVALSGEAGGDITCAMTIQGLNFAKLADNTSIPAGGVHDGTETPFRYPGVVPTIRGAADDRLTGFSYTFSAGQTLIQTTGITPKYQEPAGAEITTSHETVYTDIAQYYGPLYNANGTPRTDIEAIGWSLATDATRANGARLTIDVPRLLVTPSQINPDTGGEAAMMTVEGRADRPASGAISTLTVVNGVASYPAAA